MANPYIKFNGKTVRVGSGGGRLISPFVPIPEDTLRFEFLDGYDPTNPPDGIYANYKTAKGTWSHVYGNVYDWTCHDPKWYVAGGSSSSPSIKIYSAFASTPISNPGSYYADTEGNPLANKLFRIIGGNTSNITHIPKLFYKIGNRCTEVGWFDTHNVVNASEMFMWQSSNGMHVATLPDFDFSGITNDELTDEGLISSDRTNCVGLNQWCYSNKSITEVPSITFPSSRAISTKEMFNGCTSLASANIVGLKSSDATGMFSGKTVISAPSFTDCTLNNPKTLFGSASSGGTQYPVTVTMSNVALTGEANAMFRGCAALTAIPSFDASGLTSLQNAFRDCTALAFVPQLNTSNVTDFGGTFQGCTALTTVPLLDTSSATTIASMFSGCTSLQTVPLFNTANVTRMSSTFYTCKALTEIPLFNTANVTDMYRTFSGCYKVESGALALYQQASSQATPPSNHDGTFTKCGKDTVTGAAELAQIPSDWGGTYTPPE
jgi:surface protein